MKYLIAYHLENQDDNEIEVIPEAIYSFDETAANCFGNIWLLTSTASVEDIKTVLSQYLEMGDRLIVAAVENAGFAGFDRAITAWMNGQIDE